MSSSPRILVDTNVLSDVIYDDPKWAAWSSEQLVENAGMLAINPMIYAEICYRAPSRVMADEILRRLELAYLEIPRNALFLASKAFQKYRDMGGTRTAPLADFFIGAHAESEGLSLLTRDTARYKTYFRKVVLISP
ncbi:type II toxin-antitoxin system VapC family toxin [soil metagenome]